MSGATSAMLAYVQGEDRSVVVEAHFADGLHCGALNGADVLSAGREPALKTLKLRD